MSYPVPPGSSGGITRSTKLLTTVLAALAVVTVLVVALVVRDAGSKDGAPTPAAASEPASSVVDGAAPSASPSPSEAPPAVPVAPVEGAYVGAGGERPAGAEPLPTYVSRYGNLLSAHLLTPTGGIGCDFNTADPALEGAQGGCGVRSFNRASSPLGCEDRSGTCKGKWFLPFKNNVVQGAVSTSGTTGWMNQPANDGYTVPRVEYGKVYYFDVWVIASEMNGLTVWNTTTGSGVFLSNEGVRTFAGPGKTTPASGDDRGGDVVLGALPSNGIGYGSVKPSEVYAGGSPTSRITGVTWSEWGGDRAVGTGTGTWREGRVGSEKQIPATIVASEIGTCKGKRAYMKVTWYFPSKGEIEGSRSSMDICWND